MTTPIDRESVDPLHVKHPADGIIRRVDEQYDTHIEVALNPYGAWLAIQNLCAALDAAEADKQLAVAAALREAAAKASAMSDSFDELGHVDHAVAAHDVSQAILALIPDTGAALDRALAAERDALAGKLERVTAAYRLEAMRRDDYSHDAFDLHIATINGDKT